jgi:hypothetical protein
MVILASPAASSVTRMDGVDLWASADTAQEIDLLQRLIDIVCESTGNPLEAPEKGRITMVQIKRRIIDGRCHGADSGSKAQPRRTGVTSILICSFR